MSRVALWVVLIVRNSSTGKSSKKNFNGKPSTESRKAGGGGHPRCCSPLPPRRPPLRPRPARARGTLNAGGCRHRNNSRPGRPPSSFSSLGTSKRKKIRLALCRMSQPHATLSRVSLKHRLSTYYSHVAPELLLPIVTPKDWDERFDAGEEDGR